MSDDSAARPGAADGNRPPAHPTGDPPPPASLAARGNPPPAPPSPLEPAVPASASGEGKGGSRAPAGEPLPVAGDVAPIIETRRSPRPVAAGAGRWSDERVEAWIGTLLRLGVVAAAIVASIGAVAFIARYGAQRADYHTFQGVPSGLDSVRGVLAGALALRSRWIVQLGLLLLIATPIARVALSLVAFVLQRDRTYVVVTALVLALLLFSLMGPGF